MAGRTIVVGDIHGDLDALTRLLGRLPTLDADDTMVFLGDYVDRGPRSAEVVDFVRLHLPQQTAAKLVFLRGNHEDAWIRVVREGWPAFLMPRNNGALETLRSYTGGAVPDRADVPTTADYKAMERGTFLPADVVTWMESLLFYYENEHAIFVHAGVPEVDGKFVHPSEVADPVIMLWIRTKDFFERYRGKRIVVGHTVTKLLPQHLSSHTPEDPDDLFAGENVLAIDTGAGKGGFLTAVELPGVIVYESRDPATGSA